jgi:hypothetical protein
MPLSRMILASFAGLEVDVAKKRGSSKRTRVSPRGDARFVKRTAKGRFSESDDVGRSQKADRRKKAKKKVKPGHGDQGDQRRRRTRSSR